MAVLNAWQKIDRVLASWVGDGADGSATISSDPNTRATYTGSASSTAGTAGSSSFANGDLVLIHQTQGTGVGQWEINQITSGGGSTSLTMEVANHYTFGTGAQIIKIPRYTTATVSAHSTTAWNGTTGGVEVIAASTSITVSGALDGLGKGYRGGADRTGANLVGYQGEGETGTGSTSTSNNTTGGGGGWNGDWRVAAGGGHLAAGGGYQAPYCIGGSASSDSTDGINISLGGGGGGGGTGADGSAHSGEGGRSGAILIIISPDITCSNTVTTKGQDGHNSYYGDNQEGAGGSGGYILFVCVTASLGTGNVIATNGGGSTYGGSNGKIAIQHSDTITGTSTPSFTDSTDSSLIIETVSSIKQFAMLGVG